MEEYFDRKELYGDDFSIEQICEWYKLEAEAYADISNHEMEEAAYCVIKENINSEAVAK